MNVLCDPEELVFLFDHNSFVGSLKKTTNTVIFFVEIHRVASGKRTHKARHRVAFDRANEEVKMIGHETVGGELDGFFVIIGFTRGSVGYFGI